VTANGPNGGQNKRAPSSQFSSGKRATADQRVDDFFTFAQADQTGVVRDVNVLNSHLLSTHRYQLTNASCIR
jgi:hypothetical protein